ncbi:hypothetical protein SCHPADRAFT_686616 [Schizopora paradoxa]|uniref:Uncharacterized protein n=1 Tax=Schizopora paradoxa TaxID=27342 RepID=A0A0H2RP18_9AGAM|nr:hypothetical protein SCHPADRAFT_686616 [Schizopora paradoxa]
MHLKKRVVVALICDLENNLEEFEEQIFVQEEQTGIILPQHLGTFVFLSTVKPEYLEVRVDSDYNYVASLVDQQLSFLLDRTLLRTPLCRLKHLTLPKLPTLFEFTRFQVESVSSLHFVLELKLDIKAVKFLECFPSLQELEVTLEVNGGGLTLFAPGECIPIQNISHLRLRVLLFYDPDDFSYREARLALIGCFFPDVVKMDLHLEFQSDLSYRKPLYRSEWDFRPPIDGLFRLKNRYPSLEYLSMTFRITDLLERSTNEIGERPVAAAVFPLSCLPSLKHLKISTDLQIIVSSLIPEYFQRKTMRFPALQSLRIEGSRLKIQKWVGLVMLILKEQGKWETFEELVMPLGSEDPLFGTSGGVLNGEAIRANTGTDHEWNLKSNLNKRCGA